MFMYIEMAKTCLKIKMCEMCMQINVGVSRLEDMLLKALMFRSGKWKRSNEPNKLNTGPI